VVNDTGNVLRANSYITQLAGWTIDELHGRYMWMLFPRDEREIARQAMRQALADTTARQFTSSMVARDHGRLVIDWTVQALPGPPSEFVQGRALLVVGHDMTELLDARRQGSQVERLAAIGQAMVTLAHESRNLLQRSQACLERASWRLNEQPEALGLVNRSRQVQHDLAHLLDDVRAYAAPVQLTLAPCDVREAWREAWDQVLVSLPNRHAELRECAGDIDTWCVADRFRLLQVFRNLLENSFEACSGQVKVEIHCAEVEHGGRPLLRLSFRDDGIGIAARDRPRLFEPFWTTRPHGTGLGLVISRRIVEGHGGKIVAGNNEPPGTEIIITLPRTGP
jgi:PAS domain S-box-containing protein